MARCLWLALATLASCDPDVSSSYVVAVDNMGQPITRLSVPLSPVGQIRDLQVTIANASDLQASPIALAFTGEAANDFDIVSGCQGVALGPRQSCVAMITFQSNTVGKRSADLEITSDGTTIVTLLTDVFQPAVR